jgi:LysR family cyn operon transcriptional activator
VFLGVEELSGSRVEADVLAGRLHLGVAFVPPVGPDVAARALFEEELVLIVPAGHPLARRPRLPLPALDGQTLVLLPAGYSTRRLLDDQLRTVGARPRVVAEMNSVEGLLATVRQGGGATVLPALALARGGAGLKAVALTDPGLRRTVGLLWRQGTHQGPAALAFASTLTAVVGEYLARRARSR